MFSIDKYPRISVVIPSFNQGQYIEETLLSVMGQSYPNLEVIVIDGGSTDGTVEILEKYSGQLSYWHSRKDRGQADAINQGMNLSSGDILCWLNSDDMYLPGTLLDIGKQFYGAIDECRLVYGTAITIIQMDGKLQSHAANTAPFDPLKLTHFDYIAQPSSFWTRKLWKSTGELNINYSYVLDWEWFLRAASIAKFEDVPKLYSICRYHPDHKTSNGGTERRKEILNVVKQFSSCYWIELYSETEKCHARITKVRNSLKSLKIPRAHLIVPFLFPQLKHKIRDSQDFMEVWVMLGF